MNRTSETRGPASSGGTYIGSLLALGCAWPVQAGPPQGSALASVPIRCERNLILMPVSVAGSEPFHVVLDTGMPTRGVVLYRSARVDELPLRFEEAPGLSGAGGSSAEVRTRVAAGAQLTVGGLVLDDVPVISVAAPAGFPHTHDGIIGSELFERFAVRVDVDAQRLELLDAKTLTPAEGASVVPLHFRDSAPFLDARVATGAGEPLKAELAIDLGAGHALWLNDSREKRFGAPPGAIATRLGRGLSGALQGRVGRVRRLELGDFALEQVVAIFPDGDQQHPGDVDFRDGFIGGGTLTRFRVTFDYAGKRMLLERGARFGDPFEHDMTGMTLDFAGEDRRVVAALVEGSPAAQAGVQVGDALIAVDGRPVSELGTDGLTLALRVANAEVRLTFERGPEKLEKRIRLRRLV